MTTKQSKSDKKLKVTLTSSTFGRKPGHAACVQGLGLNRRIRNSVIVADTAQNRGMINKVAYLLQVEEI